MKEWLKHEYTSNIDEFVMNLENERGFSPVGELVHSYTRPDEQGESVCYEVYQVHSTFLRSRTKLIIPSLHCASGRCYDAWADRLS